MTISDWCRMRVRLPRVLHQVGTMLLGYLLGIWLVHLSGSWSYPLLWAGISVLVWALLSLPSGDRDELAEVARSLGLKNPWEFSAISERQRRSRARTGFEYGLSPVEAGQWRSGRTTRMLLMALLSLERGREVLIVAKSGGLAHDLARLLADTWRVRHGRELAPPIHYSQASAPVMASIARMRPVDLYVDHSVYETALSFEVAMLDDGPVVLSMGRSYFGVDVALNLDNPGFPFLAYAPATARQAVGRLGTLDRTYLHVDWAAKL